MVAFDYSSWYGKQAAFEGRLVEIETVFVDRGFSLRNPPEVTVGEECSTDGGLSGLHGAVFEYTAGFELPASSGQIDSNLRMEVRDTIELMGWKKENDASFTSAPGVSIIVQFFADGALIQARTDCWYDGIECSN